MIYPNARLGSFLRQRAEFALIDDTENYKRLRVQLHGKGIVLRDETLGVSLKTKKQQIARAGDFLVAEIDAKVGGFGIVPALLDGAIVSSHYFLFEIDESVCLSGWLDAFIRSGRLEEQVAARGSTNYAAIRPSQVLEFEIPLPSLPEQRRVARWLDVIAGKLQEAGALRRSAGVLGDATWAAVARNLIAGLGASERPLGDLASVHGGGTPSKSDPTMWGGNIPWVSPKDMKSEEIAGTIEQISEEATEASPAKILPPPCVLLVVRGMILARHVPVAVLRIPAAINQDMKALFPKEGILAEYLSAVLRAHNDRLLDLVERSTHDTRKLETSKLVAFPVPVPGLKEQRAVLARLGDLSVRTRTLRDLQSSAAGNLSRVMPSLFGRVFAGESSGAWPNPSDRLQRDDRLPNTPGR